MVFWHTVERIVLLEWSLPLYNYNYIVTVNHCLIHQLYYTDSKKLPQYIREKWVPTTERLYRAPPQKEHDHWGTIIPSRKGYHSDDVPKVPLRTCVEKDLFSFYVYLHERPSFGTQHTAHTHTHTFVFTLYIYRQVLIHIRIYTTHT